MLSSRSTQKPLFFKTRPSVEIHKISLNVIQRFSSLDRCLCWSWGLSCFDLGNCQCTYVVRSCHRNHSTYVIGFHTSKHYFQPEMEYLVKCPPSWLLDALVPWCHVRGAFRCGPGDSLVDADWPDRLPSIILVMVNRPTSLAQKFPLRMVAKA